MRSIASTLRPLERGFSRAKNVLNDVSAESSVLRVFLDEFLVKNQLSLARV